MLKNVFLSLHTFLSGSDESSHYHLVITQNGLFKVKTCCLPTVIHLTYGTETKVFIIITVRLKPQVRGGSLSGSVRDVQALTFRDMQHFKGFKVCSESSSLLKARSLITSGYVLLCFLKKEDLILQELAGMMHDGCTND